MFCGEAFALPQDWPCNTDNIDLSSVGVGTSYGKQYRGNNGEYEIVIDNYDATEPSANCGTTGCTGTIKNLQTGKSENLRFGCTYYSEKENLHCARLAEEYILAPSDAGIYAVGYCPDVPSNIMKINIADCNKCHCAAYYYDDKTKTSEKNYLACTVEGSALHCFTSYAYEAWRNFENQPDDYANCVGLDM